MILVVGLCASSSAGVWWRSYVRRQEVGNFKDSASIAASALQAALERDGDLTATATVLVHTDPHLTSSKFANWFSLLQSEDHFSGAFGLTYIEKVSSTDLATFERETTANPPFGIAPTGSTVLPAGTHSPYCLTRLGAVKLAPSLHISFAEAAPIMSMVIANLNLCDLPIGTDLREASASGQPAVSTLPEIVAKAPVVPGVAKPSHALLTLLRKSGLIVTLTPVYGAGRSASFAATQGWVLTVYQASAIVGPILASHHGFAATLSYKDPHQGWTTLYRTGSTNSGLVQTFPLQAHGMWSVTLSEPWPTTALSATVQGLVVLLGGLLVTLLVFLLLLVLMRSRTNVLKLVDERTSQLHHQALHDALTDLPNRTLIFDRVERMLATARQEESDVAVLYVDLDQFKNVNDTFGHAAGDDMLREAARRFTSILPEHATIGRLGGDEFVVLLDDPSEAARPETVATRLLQVLEEPFRVGNSQHAVSLKGATIGIATGLRESAEALLGDADIALYSAKTRSHKGFEVFRPEMRVATEHRVELEAQLREALAEGQFDVVYQPIFSFDDTRPVGAEALLRWNHPTRGVVSPAEFIPILETTGMILDVGMFVLDHACTCVSRWRLSHPSFYVSVNVSGRQFEHAPFTEDVHDCLTRFSIPPEALTLELTETAVMRDYQTASRRLRSLRHTGVRIAIDDFGTGYSSLAYLQEFQVDALKVDQSFVSRMSLSPRGTNIVRTIIQLGQDLHLHTIAEGIESEAQLRRLQEYGCDAGQGFLLAVPAPASTLDARLAGADMTPWPVSR
ncbi:MAG: putative bifunctional diguanylate cyclase/phosphodiesterase [Acidimicrobiales bacterium]